MTKAAVDHEMAQALQYLEEFKNAKTSKDALEAWENLLIRIKATLDKADRLGTREKGRGAWSRLKPEIEQDPVLAYLTAARDEKTHGLEIVAVKTEAGVRIEALSGSAYIQRLTLGPNGSFHLTAPEASPDFALNVAYTPESIRPQPVPRGGTRAQDYIHPPANMSPADMGDHALGRLAEFVARLT